MAFPNATYFSEWDNGVQIGVPCEWDRDERKARVVVEVEVYGLDNHVRDFVHYDGEEIEIDSSREDEEGWFYEKGKFPKEEEVDTDLTG